MLQIRNNVFETNSSSTHSITISSKVINDTFNILPIIDNKIPILFGCFGWEVKTYTDVVNKYKYLCTMFFELECRGISDIYDIHKKPGFKIINDAIKFYYNNVLKGEIKDVTGNKVKGRIKGIYINPDYISFEYSGNKDYPIYLNAGIDHQSVYYYSISKGKIIENRNKASLQAWLLYHKISAEKFIFSPVVEVNTDNDNH